ncbi:MAG: cadherin-like beta sandwich domain-containing protein [Tannerella sp.]|jgi:hypothetical protein|nr:cadherin-like beta sandwich domain-containing protein [Tannerella sp.]
MKKIIKYGFLSLVAMLGFMACSESLDEIKEVNYPRPFSPTDVKVEITDQVNAEIAWKEVDNARSYVVELYKNDSLEYAADALDTTLADALPPVQFKDLEKNIAYSVRVKAVKNDGTESKWEGATFVTKAKEVKITEWNFSEGDVGALAAELGHNTTFEDVKTVDGLTFTAAAGKPMRFVDYSASSGNYSFTRYLDLQGGGTAYEATERNRCVSFNVTEPCIISVYYSADAGRTIEAYTASKVIGTAATTGKANVGIMTVNWTETNGEIFIRSQSSGIYIYMIRTSVGEVYTPSTLSDLTGLTVSEGTLTPAFAGSVYDYTIDIPFSTKSITFTPAKGHLNQSVRGELTVNIAAAQTEHRLEVVAEDGETGSTYLFTINRDATGSDDATLRSLTLTGGGKLTPEFDPGEFSYVYEIDNTVSAVTISGAATHPYATIGGSGATYSGLQLGNNGPYAITVIAENKSVVKTYSITVKAVVPPSDDPDRYWNFSDPQFSSVLPATWTTEYTVNGLSLIGGGSGMGYNTNGKKSDQDVSFTHRMQFNGTGNISTPARVAKFHVAGPCRITVWGLSGSGSQTRNLVVSDGTTALTNLPIADTFSGSNGGNVVEAYYDYTGAAGDIYLYSNPTQEGEATSVGGLNLYAIGLVHQ